MNAEYWKSEAKHLLHILSYTERELEKSNGCIERMARGPLSDEEIYTLYRHSLDWRTFARDIERRHGIGE